MHLHESPGQSITLKGDKIITKDKIYGNIDISDSTVQSILRTPAMQRLKDISQYGTHTIRNPEFNTSRFEHSIGVYYLLKTLGASYEEQIAGLIHDIPHTAFSHVIDYVYGKQEDQAHHEDFHHTIIMNSDIPNILKANKLDTDYLLDETNFPLLEKEIPDICADRIDYFIRDSFTVGLITAEKAAQHFNSLTCINNEVIIKGLAAAKEIAIQFMHMNRTFWGSAWQAGSYQLLADAVKFAVEHNIITEDDFFSTDPLLINKLKSSGINKITNAFKLLTGDNIAEGTEDNHTFAAKTKARFIDPKFIEKGNIQRLSDIDPEFKQKIEEFKKFYEKPYFIKVESI